MSFSQKIKLTLLGTLLMLTGCAATRWGHPVNSQYDFNRDRAECNMMANQATPNNSIAYDPRMTPIQQANMGSYNAGANIGRALNIQSFFENCMYSRGYFKDSR